jgi:hypothetical protein
MGLVYLHHYRLFLVVAQGDFELHLSSVVIDPPVISLLPFANHIESIADMDANHLVLRCVPDVAGDSVPDHHQCQSYRRLGEESDTAANLIACVKIDALPQVRRDSGDDRLRKSVRYFRFFSSAA